MQVDWVMGDDWEVERSYNSTFLELKEFIEEERGINRHRIQVRLKGKVVVPNREKWQLRRLGITNGMMILIEPTMNGSWYWNPYSYYRDKLLLDVEAIIDQHDGRLLLTILNELITCPPPITTSLRVFLRTYPERIHIYTNIGDNTMYVSRAKGLLQPPTFTLLNPTLGYFQHFKTDVTDIIEDVRDEEEEEEKRKEEEERANREAEQAREEEKKEEEGEDSKENANAAIVETNTRKVPVDEEQQVALNADILD
ncbi:hypothetical protein EON65_36420 [archaeon]|nr:MAG: hypothetical protein EON65_36420 [archaeon]